MCMIVIEDRRFRNPEPEIRAFAIPAILLEMLPCPGHGAYARSVYRLA